MPAQVSKRGRPQSQRERPKGANHTKCAAGASAWMANPAAENLSLHGEEVMVLAFVDASGGNLKPQTTQQSLKGLNAQRARVTVRKHIHPGADLAWRCKQESTALVQCNCNLRKHNLLRSLWQQENQPHGNHSIEGAIEISRLLRRRALRLCHGEPLTEGTQQPRRSIQAIAHTARLHRHLA